MRTHALALVLILVLSSFGMACTRHGAVADKPAAVQTQTIAPAAAQPAPTGTDSMTQTVDIEDSRSEDDGGTIRTATSTSGVKSPAKTKPAPVKKH